MYFERATALIIIIKIIYVFRKWVFIRYSSTQSTTKSGAKQRGMRAS